VVADVYQDIHRDAIVFPSASVAPHGPIIVPMLSAKKAINDYCGGNWIGGGGLTVTETVAVVMPFVPMAVIT
jgi:hypothetical protein